MEDDTADMKLCLQCNNTKYINEFSKNKTSKNGFRKECKSCHSLNVMKLRINSIAFKKYKNSDDYKNLQKIAQIKYKKKKGKHLLNQESKLRLKKQRELVSDSYIKKQLKEKGFLNFNSEIIEVQKIIIKTKRLCKTLQN